MVKVTEEVVNKLSDEDSFLQSNLWKLHNGKAKIVQVGDHYECVDV